ncbi:hypothetical protein BC835DRAFT_775459 [Cytidiella melzeri]|nr:hypothetical protein BC835DRAFT_775459 [Cytidiella melzeri]
MTTNVVADDVVLCACNIPAMKRTSRTPENPGRGFYACSRSREDSQRCKYFEWEDEHKAALAQSNHLLSPPSTPSSSTQQTVTPPPSQAQRALLARGQTPQTSSATMSSTTARPHVPSTPSARLFTSIPQTPSVNGSPATPSQRALKPSQKLTPAQKEKRLQGIRLGLSQSSELPPPNPSSARSNTHSKEAGERDKAADHQAGDRGPLPSVKRPLAGIDHELRKVASPLKRSFIEESSDEDQFWQSEEGGSGTRPHKIQRSSPLGIAEVPPSTPQTKGKERELASSSTVRSDPENPFELHGREVSGSTQGGSTAPAALASLTTDEVSSFAHGLLAYVEEDRRKERRINALQKTDLFKTNRMLELETQLGETRIQLDVCANKLGKALAEVAQYQITDQKQKDRIAYLERIIEARTFRRSED